MVETAVVQNKDDEIDKVKENKMAATLTTW
jgi:hypothetical protein